MKLDITETARQVAVFLAKAATRMPRRTILVLWEVFPIPYFALATQGFGVTDLSVQHVKSAIYKLRHLELHAMVKACMTL